jgi:hypothetical protein
LYIYNRNRFIYLIIIFTYCWNIDVHISGMSMNLFLVWSWSIHIFCISCPSTNQLLVMIQELNLHSVCFASPNKVLNHKTVQWASWAIFPSLLIVAAHYSHCFFDRKYRSIWSTAVLLEKLEMQNSQGKIDEFRI